MGPRALLRLNNTDLSWFGDAFPAISALCRHLTSLYSAAASAEA
jgi:hypothetical protein